jgi:hypothetical protein
MPIQFQHTSAGVSDSARNAENNIETSIVTGGGYMIIAVHCQFSLFAAEKRDISSAHHSPSNGMTPKSSCSGPFLTMNFAMYETANSASTAAA